MAEETAKVKEDGSNEKVKGEMIASYHISVSSFRLSLRSFHFFFFTFCENLWRLCVSGCVCGGGIYDDDWQRY